jgi:hypothetical protein
LPFFWLAEKVNASNSSLPAKDHLRLAPSAFGREDKRFLDTLSESQFETFRSWFANLSADEQNAILDTVM